MIRSALRKIIAFLGSARLAIWLLVFVGVWSMLATFIPQGEVSAPDVAAWVVAHPVVAPAVRALGLHQAFSAFVFRIGVVALAMATALCAWRRTKIAIARMRTLRKAMVADAQSLSTDHDLEIACSPTLSEADALSRAAEALEHVGIRTKRRGALLSAVSPGWAVWGSPVFHWGLVAFILVISVGSLQRSEGLMGVAVGETKPDAPESYRVLQAGPLHDWQRVQRSIRVDAFDTDYRTGEIDRGPVPTVSVLDGAGRVIKTQRIYPNNPLQTGSLAIHPAEFGFAATLTVLDAGGVERGRAIQLIDISDEASSGTVPVEPLSFADDAGNQLVVSVTVPMERRGGQLSVPQERIARVAVFTVDGGPVLDRVIGPAEEIALPTGSTLRLDELGFYARLSVVDDPAIPFLYVALAIAMIGLTLAVVVRQQLVLATVVGGEDGPILVAMVRLWRNVPTSRKEVESELARALRGDQEENAS